MAPGSNERQPNDLEQLARVRFDPLSDAEIKLLRAAPNGKTAYCGPSAREDDSENDPANSDNWGQERKIRAELIRWICVDHTAKERVDPRGIRVYAARITGKLDLSFAVIPFFLGLHRCGLSEDIDLEFAEVPFLDLSETSLPSLNADQATVRGTVRLQGLRSNGAVRLRGARVGGNLECDGGNFQNPARRGTAGSGVALDATTAKVAGAVLLRNGFAAQGMVLLFGAEIGSNLECDGGKFQNLTVAGVAESGIALNADGVKVAGSVLFRYGFTAKGTVWLPGAEIMGTLECSGGKFQNPAVAGVSGSGLALIAESIKVGGGVVLRNGFAAEGRVWLQDAEIGSSLDCDGGKFQNPAVAGIASSGLALSAAGAKVARSVLLRNGFTAEGEVRLHSAEIGATLECDGGRFRNRAAAAVAGSGMALNAEGTKVGGAVLLRNGFVAEGKVWLLGAEIGGNLVCDGGKFQNPSVAEVAESGTALSAVGAKVGGSVLIFDGFAAEGAVKLIHAQIGGTLAYWSAPLESLDLRNASAGALLDEEKGWPEFGKLFLDGFNYGRIAGGPVDATGRLAWLARQSSFTRHPYRQLARVLRDAGDDRGWRQVCVAMEQRAWQRKPWFVRPLGWALRGTIGFGYSSRLALGWLLLLVVVGALVYWQGYNAGSMVPTSKDAYESYVTGKGLPAYYEAFQPVPYSLENSFPLVKFGIQDKWAPGPDGRPVGSQPVNRASRLPSFVVSPRFLRWFRWLQISAAWILATLFVAGVSGVVRKD